MAEIKVPFHRAAITKDEEAAVLDVLRSGWLTTKTHGSTKHLLLK